MRRLATPNGAVVITDAAPRASVVAATLAFPLTAARRSDVLAAPMAAAHWARLLTATAGTRVEPLVTTDLVGVTVELFPHRGATLRAIPEWLRVARRPLTDPDDLRRLSLTRLSTRDRWSDGVRRALFGPEHRYGIGATEVSSHISTCGATDLDDAVRSLASVPPILALSVPAPSDLTDALAGMEFAAAPKRVRLPAQRMVDMTLSLSDGRAYYVLGTPGVALGAPDKFAVHVAWAVLGGRDGLLDRRLRRDHALTYSLAAFSREFAEGGYGMCLACCDGDAADEVAGHIADVLTELAAGGVDPGQVASAKERLVIAHLRAAQTARGTTERLCGYEVAGGVADYAESVAAVTIESIVDAAAGLLAIRTS